MAKQLQYIKSTPAHLSRVLYCITFFTLINLITVPYIRLLAGTMGRGIYRDNLSERSWVLIIFMLLCTFGFFWGNKKTFNSVKRESNRIWVLHLGIDVLIYAASMPLVLLIHPFLDKPDAVMTDLWNPVMMLLLLSIKYTILRIRYAQRDDQYMSR
ncbi:hypothetical protein SAMN05428949_2879 [Chitinophaga sp. YR627]|uniref:hypothetical protein n=1 Tax=Chitinophaga sp. YR627 TaxID=1881041 RepID=UPI0008F311D3|nr:hypothetical protein [Chitinophaga sp. YR627]SFN45368.1 hypothetical protein SAMN05428949_2879 [Chitinophaga sp. YR627]